MKLKDFDYDLPKNLIAQEPMKPRDHSRLLVLDKLSGKIKHQRFYNIVNYLRQGDVLVLNNTKVMPARLIGKKADTGGKVEVFLLKKNPPNSLYQGGSLDSRLRLRGNDKDNLLKGAGETWQCLIGGKKRKEDLRVEFSGGLRAKILKNNNDGAWQVQFNKSGASFLKIVKKIGRVPLPPYIKRPKNKKAKKQESKNYQTVYADDKKFGSVAAPTAGFHFTPALLKKIKNKGVRIAYVTLRIGLGTFAPVKVDDITKHQMHAEWLEVSKKTLANIVKAKSEGGRIIAVGTTSARTLESVFKNYSNFCHCEEQRRRSNLMYSALDQRLLRRPEYGTSRYDRNYSGWTNIFIYPPFKFKAVDALITNFHLPKSTLLMLVSAFACTERSRSAGRKKILNTYREAIKKKYRFYSYGDAMLII